jgi:SAM-dependent MidA family methyltransferase
MTHDDGRDRGGLGMQVGLRRDPLPDPQAVGEDAVLVARLRAEIRGSGPIPFARFMERALYEPGHGYYRRARPAPGRSGDFLTAPEAHPIFGAAIGRLLEQAWDAMGRPAPFVVTEPGAGGGALAAGMLDGLRALGSPLLDALRYRPGDIEPARLITVRDRLVAMGLGDRLVAMGPGHGPAAEPAAGSGETGAVVANEVLDALPVHRVVGRDGGPRELLVGIADDGRFEWVEAELSTRALADRLAAEGVVLEEGQLAELCLGLDAWVADATRHLARGIVLLIDYAAEPDELYAGGRRDGTLRAFAAHAVGGDPFRHVGRQDLTATVDLGAVRAAAAAAGLAPLGETTQAELLASTATGALTSAYLRRPGASLEDTLELRSALARLLDPRGMGGYRVLAFGRGMPGGTALAGLQRLRPGS